MASCEKCWRDAYARMQMLGGSQAEHYEALITKRELANEVCSPEEQAGPYWDEERQIDNRKHQSPDSLSCCNMHNRNCEPPYELCCDQCSEREHPGHRTTECIAPDLSGKGKTRSVSKPRPDESFDDYYERVSIAAALRRFSQAVANCWEEFKGTIR